MVDHLRPGIFIQENLDPLTESVSGVPGVAVATFVAAGNRGPNVPTKITSMAQFQRLFGTFQAVHGKQRYLNYAVQQYFNNGGNGCYVLRVENTDSAYATVNLNDVQVTPATALTVTATSQGEWGNSIYVEVRGSTASDRFDFLVYLGGSTAANLVETFVDLSLNPSDPRYAIGLINSPIAGSTYVAVSNPKDIAEWHYAVGTDAPKTGVGPKVLTAGDDGSVAPDLAAACVERLDAVDGILNVNLPAVSDTTVLNAVITWAEGRGDVFVVVDGPVPPQGTQTNSQVSQTYLNMATGVNAVKISSYAAVYGPWILVQDPASAIPGATRYLPPGGAVLGIYAQSDTINGPQKTPAGIKADINGVIELEARFSADQLDSLNQNGINVIKMVPGAGFCVFGGRTMTNGFPDRYVSIRRTLQQLRHDFILLTRFAIFEPNNSALWDQITSVLSNYLTTQMQQGLLSGSTQETAFFVTCDSSNNTLTSAQAGVVNVSVGVALNSPAEFIIITISQYQGGSTVTEGA